MISAMGQSTMPLTAKLTAATVFMQKPPQFLRPFLRWRFVKPMKPRAASIRMPTPAPKQPREIPTANSQASARQLTAVPEHTGERPGYERDRAGGVGDERRHPRRDERREGEERAAAGNGVHDAADEGCHSRGQESADGDGGERRIREQQG